MASKSNPLPLGVTLRDLALLRASDVELSSLLPPPASAATRPANKDGGAEQESVDSTVQQSYEFVRESRAAIKLLDRGDVDKEGSKVEDIRSQLGDVLLGLD